MSAVTPAGQPAAHIHASLVGDYASRTLNKGDFRGVMLAAGGKAAYIRSDRGDILGISRPDQPAHTRFIQAALDMGRLYEGTEVTGDGNGMTLANGIWLDIAGATLWKRQPIECSQKATLATLTESYEKALVVALMRPDADGLGIAITELASAFYREEEPAGLLVESPFVAAAMGPVRRISKACRLGEVERAFAEMKKLIGLGQGLTPSGDDFVGGLLFAAWHLGESYPAYLAWDVDRANRLVNYSASATNLISHTFLKDYCEGQGPEPLHGLMDALLTGADASQIEAHFQKVTRIGHSSGWDILAGLLTGMQLATRAVLR